MVLRVGVVLLVLLLITLVPLRTGGGGEPHGSPPRLAAGLLDPHVGTVALAHDEQPTNNEDEDHEHDDEDEDDSDNEDDDGDNDNGDNDNGDNDNSDNDNGDNDNAIENRGASVVFSPAEAVPGVPPVTQASGTSTGGDSTIAFPDNRIVVTVFPLMPRGVTITARLIDPGTVPAAPGARVGDLIFALEAQDSAGRLAMLPAEVNLDIGYTERDAAGLDDRAVTLSWLDPATSQWKAAPKLVTNPAGNTVAASVTQLGTYVVSVP